MVSTGETGKHLCKIILNLLISVVVFLLIIFVLPRVIVFFMPFVVGAVIAMLANPIVRVLEEHVKLRRKAGTVFTIVVVVGLVALILYGIGNLLMQQAIGFISNLPQMWESLEHELSEIASRFQGFYDKMPLQTQQQWNQIFRNLQSYIGDMVGRLSSPTVELVGNVAKNVPGILVGIVMGLLSAYFFVADRAWMNHVWHLYAPQGIKERCRIVSDSLKRAFGGYLMAQLRIEIWMYLLLVIGLSIAGVNYVMLVALGIAVLDLLPIFGTGTVLLPWAVIKVLGTDYRTAVILIALWGIGQILRQLIQPRIVGDSLGMPPIPTLILLHVGWKINGVWGMILAVPIGLVFLNLYKEGAFDTAKDSVVILTRDLASFCKYRREDFMFYKRFEGLQQSEPEETKAQIAELRDEDQTRNKESDDEA